MPEIKCPKCGGKVVADECHDLAISKGQVYGLYTGYCEQCNAEIGWDEWYSVSSYENITIRDQRLPAP